MLSTLGIVHVGGTPSEVGSNVQRRLGGKSLIHQTVRRVTDAMRLDGVLVLLGKNAAHQRVAESVPLDIPVYFADGHDELSRVVDALAVYSPRAVVLVPANAPFVDPVFIDRLIHIADQDPQQDYIGYCRQGGSPASGSSLGVFAEWCSARALRRAGREATLAEDRRQVTRYVYRQPETFRVRLVTMPEALDHDDLRLTVDGMEDLEHAQEIIDALGADDCDWQRIAGLLGQQPVLREQMARLNDAVGVDH